MSSNETISPRGPVLAASPEFRIDLDAGRIRTPRLRLVAATAALLRAELAGPDVLAAALGTTVPPHWPPELYDRDAVLHSLAAAEASAHDPPRWGSWYVVEPSADGQSDTLAGVCGFHGPPTGEGDVEVGYSLLPAFRGRGYATEAVRALASFAFADPAVRRVAAETLPHLGASIRVMERAGFAPADDPSSPEVVRYELPRPDPAARLAELGWDAAWAADFAAVAGPGHVPARVVARHRGLWIVADADGERPASVSGRLLHEAGDGDGLPAVGDWVALEPGTTDGTARIAELLPRRSVFRRKAAGAAARAQTVAANVDLALVVTAMDGDLNPRRLERYLALAWESGAVPLVVLSKSDLCADPASALAVASAAAPGVEVVPVSAATGAGLDRLAAHLRPGRTAVLLGSSGVGKSTLANRLAGAERLRTGEVREDGKGRHTTTHRELLRLAGGALLVDTPGMRELGLWDADAGLDAAFGDVEALAAECRFGDCGHDAEPGCAVRAAVDEGRLDPARLGSWRGLRRELAYLDRRRDEAAAAAERSRVRSLHREMRAHLRRKRG